MMPAGESPTGVPAGAQPDTSKRGVSGFARESGEDALKLSHDGRTPEYRSGAEVRSDRYTFDGYISYLFSVYVDLDRNMDFNLRSNRIIESIQEFFPRSVMDTDPAAAEEPLLNDIRLVQNFLHGDGLPFECHRLLLKDFDLQFQEFPLEGTGVVVSVFPEFNTVQIYFFFRADRLTTDQLIYLRQIFNGSAPFLNRINGRKGSLSYHYQRIADHLGAKVVNREQMYLLEIRRIHPEVPYNDFMDRESRRIYGMLCGDEGWEFVPEDLARERLSHSWGSREFVKFFAFGNNAILFNMIDSASGEKYLERQTRFGTEAYGSPNDYFFLKSEAAGVNHGIFFGQETIMVIKTIAANIMSRQANRRLSKHPSLRTDLRLTKEFRAELITTINKVENLGISEMGELEQMLISNFRISPLIENIKYLLEMLESDLDLLYQQDTNRKVNLLTVFGLLISVIALLVDVFGLFH